MLLIGLGGVHERRGIEMAVIAGDELRHRPLRSGEGGINVLHFHPFATDDHDGRLRTRRPGCHKKLRIMLIPMTFAINILRSYDRSRLARSASGVALPSAPRATLLANMFFSMMRRPTEVLLAALALVFLAPQRVPAAPPVFAQETSDLKPDPAAHWGRLPNGLRYVVLPNRNPGPGPACASSSAPVRSTRPRRSAAWPIISSTWPSTAARIMRRARWSNTFSAWA